MHLGGHAAPFAAAALLWGCGGGAKVSLHGTLRGQPASAVDASFELHSIPFAQGPARLAAVALSSAPRLCAESTAGARSKGAHYLVLLIGELDKINGGLAPPSGPGDYPVVLRPTSAPASRFAIAQAIGTDAGCASVDALAATGTAGTVHLDRVSEAEVAGTLAIELQAVDGQGSPTGSADHVTGSFEAPACAGVLAAVIEAKPAVCD